MRGGTFTQTFNGQVEWQFDGGYFKLIATVSAVDVELWYQGRQSFTADQVSAGFYQREQFDKIKITTGALEAVTFLFAPDEGGTAGDVAIVTLPAPLNQAIADNADGQAAVGVGGVLPVLARPEGWNGATFDRLRADDEGAGVGALRVATRGDEIVKAGAAFLGSTVNGPVAGQVALSQLFNQAGSGVVAYVESVTFADLTATDRYEIRRGTAALGAALATYMNKNGGGSVPAIQMRGGASAAPGGTVVYNGAALANIGIRIPFDPPIRLIEGQGIFIDNFTVNHLMVASWEWREKTA